ncbi:hypothetical protein B8W96_02615 [Lentilactobacillus parakefiri]|uniref:Uncharacterized protein n=1 Tax=Lentilactobacillus parakefiri TaxID=152332 RepID=A0A269YJA1_9LACO|nr:hypothetical protein B8W98_03705 [Lentilactobacillus parakefiri]PAL01166.1 hypothetical protein B8W96_02615 [Lentilactobacillus parakefiri]
MHTCVQFAGESKDGFVAITLYIRRKVGKVFLFLDFFAFNIVETCSKPQDPATQPIRANDEQSAFIIGSNWLCSGP